jgi:hypothetical protein
MAATLHCPILRFAFAMNNMSFSKQLDFLLRAMICVCVELSQSLAYAASVPATDQSYAVRFDLDSLAPLVDFSNLNSPIEDSDRIVVCGNRLCTAGHSLTPLRLFGVNLAYDASLPNEQDAPLVAARLSKLGVNLVRLHALDARPDTDPSQAHSILLAQPFPTLNPVAIQRLKFFLVQLRDAGIYVDLNLHVGYTFKPELDGVPALPGAVSMPEQSKPLFIINKKMSDLQALYAQRLLQALGNSARNVVAMVEINNESTLVYEWMIGRFDKVVVGAYRDDLTERWQRYQIESGISDTELTGIPKVDAPIPERIKDNFFKFLITVDQAYLDKIRAAIRSINQEVIIGGSQMRFGGLANLASHASMDFMDNHFYVDSYDFRGKWWDWNNWVIRDESAATGGFTGLRNSAFFRDLSKPYVISEFNQPWPNRKAAEIIPETAVMAARQGWSAIMFYDYSHTRDYISNVPREFSLTGDVTKLIQLGQVAWLYRSGAIQPIGDPLNVKISSDLTVQSERDRVLGEVSDFLQKRAGVDPAAAFTREVGITTSRETVQSVEPSALTRSGETTFDIEHHRLVINEATVKGVVGAFTPGTRQDFGSFRIEMPQSSNGFVSILLSSRDGQPIATSRRLLLTVPGYTLGSLPNASSPQPQQLVPYRPTLDQWVTHPRDTLKGESRLELEATSQEPATQIVVHGPLWMQRVAPSIYFETAARTAVVFPLDAAGRRLRALSTTNVEKSENGLLIQLQAGKPAPWYEIAPQY